MLLGNIHILHKSPGTYPTGTVGFGDRANSTRSSQMRNWFRTPGVSGFDLGSVPDGYGTGYAWSLPQEQGAIVSRRDATISVTATGTGTRGRNVTGTASLSILAAAIGTLIASGSGTATVTITATGALQAVVLATGSASVSVTAAGALGALANGTGAATVTITATGVRYALGHMTGSADLAGASGTLTAAQVAAEVWNALAASYSTPGTFGASVGAAGGLTVEQATQLLEIFQLHGLDPDAPLEVSATTRTAGDDIDQTISEAGGTTTVQRN